MIEEKDAEKEESSTSKDVNEESSTSEEEQLEEATSEQAVEKEESTPFHEHPRFKELVTEKNELKEENKRLQQQMFEVINRSSSDNKQVIEQQLYEARTPEEKAFWQQVEKIADSKATKARDEAEKRYTQEIGGYQRMVGNIIADRFLEKHPDVKKGSPEMERIVQKAQKEASFGKDILESLDDSYKVVMFEKSAEIAVANEKKQRSLKLKEKEKANVEISEVSSKLPLKKDASMEEVFDDTAKSLGISW